jgi:predicted RNase H-like HicB family nuclease
MQMRFRLYVRRDEHGLYTVTLPGVPGYVAMDDSTDHYPASPRFSASGTTLEVVKLRIREALKLRLPWAKRRR